jgi:hypothetical protein
MDHLKRMDRNQLFSTNLEDDGTQEDLDEDGETKHSLSLEGTGPKT